MPEFDPNDHDAKTVCVFCYCASYVLNLDCFESLRKLNEMVFLEIFVVVAIIYQFDNNMIDQCVTDPALGTKSVLSAQSSVLDLIYYF